MPSDARLTRCRTSEGGSSWRPPMVIAGQRLLSMRVRALRSINSFPAPHGHAARPPRRRRVLGARRLLRPCRLSARTLPHGLLTACTSLPCPPPLLHLHIQALTASDRPLVIHRLSLAASPYRPLTHLQQRQPLAAHTASCPCLLRAPRLSLSCFPGSIPHFSCNTQNSITSQPSRTAVRTSIVRALWAVLTP